MKISVLLIYLFFIYFLDTLRSNVNVISHFNFHFSQSYPVPNTESTKTVLTTHIKMCLAVLLIYIWNTILSCASKLRNLSSGMNSADEAPHQGKNERKNLLNPLQSFIYECKHEKIFLHKWFKHNAWNEFNKIGSVFATCCMDIHAKNLAIFWNVQWII